MIKLKHKEKNLQNDVPLKLLLQVINNTSIINTS